MMHMKRHFFRTVFCLASLVVTASAVASGDTRVTATGSSTIAPLMSELGKTYEKANPKVRIEVQSGGTSRGIADVRQGSAQIGMVSRALHPDEKDLDSVLIARDGVSLIVNKSNPVKMLTKEQVVSIYTGKITNWKDVGGPNLPITVISKAEGRSTLEVFAQYFGLTPRAIKAHIIIGDNQQEIQTVSSNKAAIGYVSIGSAEFEAKNGAPIEMIDLDKFKPSTATVASGEFPISRDLNLVFNKAKLSKEAQAFLAFTTSPQARKDIEAQFFIPLSK